jgi:hypothetical protein
MRRCYVGDREGAEDFVFPTGKGWTLYVIPICDRCQWVRRPR